MKALRTDSGFSMIDTLVALLLTGIALAMIVPVFHSLTVSVAERSENMRQAVMLVNFHDRLYRLSEEVHRPYWSSPHLPNDQFAINVSNGEKVEFRTTDDSIEIHRSDTRYVYRFPDLREFTFSEKTDKTPAGFLVRFEDMDDLIIPFAEQTARSPHGGE